MAKIDPICLKSLKNKKSCPVCSGNRGKDIIHTEEEIKKTKQLISE